MLSLIQRFDYVIAKLLGRNGTVPGPETRKCKGRGYAFFAVLLQIYLYVDKLIC